MIKNSLYDINNTIIETFSGIFGIEKEAIKPHYDSDEVSVKITLRKEVITIFNFIFNLKTEELSFECLCYSFKQNERNELTFAAIPARCNQYTINAVQQTFKNIFKQSEESQNEQL